jgi:hypothetical protein
LLLVLGKGDDTFDVRRAAMESNSEICCRGAAVAPVQKSALKGSEPLLLLWSTAARQVCESQHTLDVVAAPFETPADLAWDNACRREPTHATFQRSEVHEIRHELHRTALRNNRAGAAASDSLRLARRSAAPWPR